MDPTTYAIGYTLAQCVFWAILAFLVGLPLLTFIALLINALFGPKRRR